LVTAARNYLRIETLHAANDAITNAIATLPMFRQYDIQEALHSSNDGQWIETLDARHSRKYFGLKKGVSAYTLVANHVPITARIIGTREHESHFVFDLLHNNTTDIRPERHSTDTQGTNQVNFWILHVFGYRFAPRYRNLHKKAERPGRIPASEALRRLPIKPSRRVLDSLICSKWPNIQRIMASLAQKDVTQATVVRNLSSYARQNWTKKALVELDNICRTRYLDYIDDVVLRRSVQKNAVGDVAAIDILKHVSPISLAAISICSGDSSSRRQGCTSISVRSPNATTIRISGAKRCDKR
jgi:TnpA family transposase